MDGKKEASGGSRCGAVSLYRARQQPPIRICVRNQRYLYRPPLNGEIVLFRRGCRYEFDTDLLQKIHLIIIVRVPLDLTLL